MGLSYTIIPTNELTDKQAYLEHFKSIETYEFPENFEIDINSRNPELHEIEAVILRSGCSIIEKSEEQRKKSQLSISYQLKHPNHKYESDFTLNFENKKITAMMGVHGDFNILLRIATELTKICGTMIIFSAYDAHYVEKGKTYKDIWDKLSKYWK